MLLVEVLHLCFEGRTQCFRLGFALLQFILALVECSLFLFDAVFRLLYLLVSCGYLLFQFGFFVKELFFYFEQFVLLYHFCFILGFFDSVLILLLQSHLVEII